MRRGRNNSVDPEPLLCGIKIALAYPRLGSGAAGRAGGQQSFDCRAGARAPVSLPENLVLASEKARIYASDNTHAYSDVQPDLIRNALSALSVKQLLNSNSRDAALNKLSAMPFEALRDATAFFLIERRLSPGMGEMTGDILVEP